MYIYFVILRQENNSDFEEVFKVENEVLTGEEEVYKPEPQEERPKLNRVMIQKVVN